MTRLRVICIVLFMAFFTASASPVLAAWAPPSKQGDQKYFAFHKSGVALDVATADLRECIGYMESVQPFAGPPKFAMIGDVSLSSSARAEGTVPGGMIGEVIAGMFTRSFAARAGRGNLRRCMEYKGYQRYAIEKETWKSLFDQANPEEGFAALAAGKAPAVEALKP